MTSVGDIPAEKVGYLYEVETYLNLIKISDDAVKDLVTYFQQVENPVIICMFGDHQPILENEFYEAVFAGKEMSEQERNLQKYIVPYFIWANYDVDWDAYGDMSANYLPAALTECAGLQMSPFYQYLMELHEEFPVLSLKGCLDTDGMLVDIADIWEREPIYQYRMLQYNQLYIEEYQKGIIRR